jgi:outer membrane protein OmpA-like peptidoglycan-associated protein
VFVRILSTAFLVSALAALPAAAQAQQGGGKSTTTTTTSGPVVTSDEVVLEGDTTLRPALPTINGDTGLWFVPTAETMPAGKWSASLFRANYDRKQGLTDVNQIGVTGAIGIADRFELFGSWRIIRYDRDVRPTFVDSDSTFGGVAQEFPYVRRGWSKNLAGPLIIGGKWSVIQQGRGDAISLAPRVMVKFPTGATESTTEDWDLHTELVGSREFKRQVELTGVFGGVIRGDPDEFQVSDGLTWGLGATFPSRSQFRALVEWNGEFVIKDNTRVLNPPFTAEDGSVAPNLSPIVDPTTFKFGGVWQAKNGFFVHAGGNYSPGTQGRVVNGLDIDHSAWGVDLRVGIHPGVMPPRQRVRRIRETTTITNTVTVVTPAPPAPAPNRPPTVRVQCDPSLLEPGQTSRCTAQATDPEGGPLTYRWTTTAGNLSPTDAPNTTFTAPQTEGPVTVTVTVTDNSKNEASGSATLLVQRRTVIEFEDVHFDFDRFNLRPDALKLLDEAVAKLQANPNIQVTIEGHADSIGTQQYNLALGDRRANSARDYLVMRGISAARLRTVSYGEDRPGDTNDTAAGRARNRRAHLAIIMQ